MERDPPRRSPPAWGASHSAKSREFAGLTVSVAQFEPRLRISRHHHERACVTVVLGGAFEEFFPGRSFRSEAGWILSKPAGEPHADRFGTGGSRQVILELGDDAGDAAVLPSGIRHYRDPIGLMLALRLARELDEPDDGFAGLAIRGLSLELLACHGRFDRHQGKAPRWVRAVRDLLHDRIAQPPSLAELAALAGVHHNQLLRRFRTQYGTTPASYGRRIRLAWAERLLLESDEEIAAIAVHTGFADQSHFTRCFRRHTGMTPAAYRAAKR